MNIKRGVIFSVIALLIFITPANFVRADDKARDRKTLRGIQSVVVKVHPVEVEWQAELEKVGLSESTLEASIEQQLKKAGIQVISEEASSQSEFEGILNVRLKFSGPQTHQKKIYRIR